MYEDDNDLFDSEDQEHSKTEAFSVGLILRIILAVTTAGFAYVYGYEMLIWILPEFYAKVGTALIYTFGIDFMAYEWPRLKERNATTSKQMKIANMGWMVSAIMSVIVTGVFTILVFSEFADVTGQLEQAVNIMALAIGIGMPIFQGIWYMRYENNGLASTIAVQKAEQRAMRNKTAHTITSEHQQQKMKHTLANVRRQLPGTASREGEQMAGDYFEKSTYGSGQPVAKQKDIGFEAPSGNSKMGEDAELDRLWRKISDRRSNMGDRIKYNELVKKKNRRPTSGQ